MKSSSAVFRALSIALLAAVVLYFGVQGCRYLTDPYSTTLAYRSSSEESISLTGWLVRDEVPLQGPSGTLQQMLREGEKAAAGETVVTVYSNARHRQPNSGAGAAARAAAVRAGVLSRQRRRAQARQLHHRQHPHPAR